MDAYQPVNNNCCEIQVPLGTKTNGYHLDFWWHEHLGIVMLIELNSSCYNTLEDTKSNDVKSL